MSKLVQTATLLFTLLTCSIAAAELSDDSLDALMQLSGINQQVTEIPGGVVAGMQQSMQQGAPISQEQLDKIEQAILKSFQPAAISNTIADELKDALSEAEAQQLLKWFRSDLGKKITAAEEEASSAAAYQEKFAQAESLLSDEQRVQLARRIDRLVNLTDMTLEFQKGTAIAVFNSLSRAMNPGQPVNSEAFEAKLAENEAAMQQQIEQMVTLSILYNYRNISMDEMNKYMAFLEQPATRKFNDNAINGMKLAIHRSVNEMAESMAMIFTAKK
ncbi:MAG TPA: DUF2059 domain-containing protein [Gammaproteobacteria bacterium]